MTAMYPWARQFTYIPGYWSGAQCMNVTMAIGQKYQGHPLSIYIASSCVGGGARARRYKEVVCVPMCMYTVTRQAVYMFADIWQYAHVFSTRTGYMVKRAQVSLMLTDLIGSWDGASSCLQLSRIILAAIGDPNMIVVRTILLSRRHEQAPSQDL